MRVGRRLAVYCAIGLLAGCVSAVGGWDVDVLVQAEPQLATIPGQRIGDLTPHPALADGRLLLVACRYATDRPVRVSGSGPGWPPEWAAVAIDAVARALPGIEFVTRPDGDSDLQTQPLIEIASIDDPHAEVPNGMGDTLSECDVSRITDSRLAIRGWLTKSVIRIRRAKRDQVGRVHSASDAEWVGTLMHELGHALGFTGHAAIGDSLVIRDVSRLRALGQRALAGQPVPAPNLTALYSIEPGRILGEVETSAKGRELVAAVVALVADRNARLGPAAGPLASAGDEAARLVWRWKGGLRAELRFPFWRREVGQGQPITVLASEATRRALGEAEYP